MAKPVVERTLEIDTRKLPTPERSFYANIARPNHRRDMLVFVFGQLSTTEGPPRSEVVIEIPRSALKMIIASFNPEFRHRLGASESYDLPTFPSGRVENSMSLGAALCRLVIGEYWGILDFHEILPVAADVKVEPVIRIKTGASIVKFFVSECLAASDAT